jgi:hypothetical protein
MNQRKKPLSRLSVFWAGVRIAVVFWQKVNVVKDETLEILL